jgi:hypothetical protein
VEDVVVEVVVVDIDVLVRTVVVVVDGRCVVA